MSRTRLKLLPAVVFALLAACGGSSPSASTSPAPSPESTPSAAASSAPTNIDPCTLVTAQEATQMTGTAFPAGKESTTESGAKMCTYSHVPDVVNVIVAIASDAATARAQWDQQQATAQQQLEQSFGGQGINYSVSTISVSGADRAAVATASGAFGGQTLSISAIYVLKGAVFFTFSDLALNHAAASSTAMQAEAATSATRIP